MKFCGYSKIFSTKNNSQYNLIGDFYDKMEKLFGLENIYGLGFNWTNETIEYVIGLKNKEIKNNLKIQNATYKEIDLPDDNWIIVEGYTNNLKEIYKSIYKKGALKYEIEEFFCNGKCKISYYR